MQPRYSSILFAVAVIFTVSAHSAAAAGAYILRDNGTEVRGDSILALPNGDLMLTLTGGGATMRVPNGGYKYALGPKPVELIRAQAMVKAQKYETALKVLDTAYTTHKYLGWAADTAYLKGRCFIAKKKYAKADRAYRDALRYIYIKRVAKVLLIKTARVEVRVRQKDFKGARDVLSRLKPNAHPTSIMIYNARGRVLAAEGKKSEAITQYLKSVMLFDKTAGPNRKKAYRALVRLFKDLEDKRWQRFEAAMRREHGR